MPIPFFSLLVIALIYLIRIIQLLFLVSAVASWIPPLRENRIIGFVNYLINPIIAPFRMLTSRISALRGFPLDISFLLAIIALQIIQMALYMLA